MKTLKVLLIEDDSEDRLIIKDLLEKSNLQIDLDEAASSSEGLEKLKSNSYDCAIVDYVIPGVTGLDVFMLSREAGVNTPFIFLTGYGDNDLAAELIRRGAFDYLCKRELNCGNLSYKIIKAVTDSK
ncbi:MAG: response regulator [Nitrospinae bacterium]|nr:response regulator [Nitrospinota bacterium]MDA1110125.1 response regulator [Nitrospinota bacterium]